MNNLDKELLERIEELRSFCELNGYPLHEVLEVELEYYNKELTV
jgi:hypothetical protein